MGEGESGDDGLADVDATGTPDEEIGGVIRAEGAEESEDPFEELVDVGGGAGGELMVKPLLHQRGHELGHRRHHRAGRTEDLGEQRFEVVPGRPGLVQ